ncbi:hypothetical protein JAAARDRAFT_187320 [Jaapia argillacea MUCL 33604]|uniref:Spermatogenesis-associated protein 20-like TRX domain-containing protein n=1 Tax=Jaapia argillacea MUCL 33604 TaxID=933084 RepID=A0A067QKA4_9AGAM|nr:hypothetical protein JAAARDRAFT_187320 [Jaapia argillacea MUCL 33604]
MTTHSNSPKPTNRLAAETSPYLLQHQHNPVDWYPWGSEAFEKAKKEDKPIFLSVGYSTCRWCHVMERESFESEEVARVMNEVCVNIKVDREVLPDIDRIYMLFVQATTGRGGWPMSVFLTPDLKPFFGGTYFPPSALVSLMEQIDDKWNNSRDTLVNSANKIHAALSSHLGSSPPAGTITSIKPNVESALNSYNRRFDEVNGGFGGAPKFPTTPIFTFLHTKAYFDQQDQGVQDEKSLEMAGFTLTKIARGGIHDHVGNGFHRYSVDERWHVPHFEKMLYDQSQLALAYLRQYSLTGESGYLETTLDILKYSTRDLYSPELKAFYAAEDAESLPTPTSSKKEEGAFWVWTAADIDRIFCSSQEAEIFKHHFSIKQDGNVDPQHDPHDELTGKNVLMESGSLEDTHVAMVGRFPNLTLSDVERAVREGKEKLFEEKERTRVRPHRDEKVVAAWNGMMGRALAWVSRVLEERGMQEAERWYQVAQDLAEFLEERMGMDGGRLRRVFGSEVEGVVDDYAHVISFLLALYQVRFEPKYLRRAIRLQAKQDELFWDQEKGGYFSSSIVGSNDGSRIMRLKDDQDSAEPSSNSTSLNNLVTLDAIIHATSPNLLGLSPEVSSEPEDRYERKADRLLANFSANIQDHATALPDMISAALIRESGVRTIIFSGGRSEEEAGEFVKGVRGGRWEPDVVYVRERVETGKEEGVTGRVCFGGTCGMKMDKVEDVRKKIKTGRVETS